MSVCNCPTRYRRCWANSLDLRQALSNHLLAICFDFGDTLADEASEIRDAEQITQTADLIPGAAELIHELKRREYRLALVADGRPGTYKNVLSQHNIYHLFDAFAVSELVGVEKPDPAMFLHALGALNIKQAENGRTMMVGNRLDRDVKGANDLGMVSVWLDWSPRYEQSVTEPSEKPDYTIKLPMQLLDVLDAVR